MWKNGRWVSKKEQKGSMMQTTFRSKDIDQLLAEADELIKRVDSQAIHDIEEEQRIQFENHFHSLKSLRSEVQDKIEKEGTSKNGSYSEGMHKAIDDIVAAMKALARYLT
jgi:hypothetical protein